MPGAVAAPSDGLWRVGRLPNPIALPDPIPPAELTATSGYRFDSPGGYYSVLYFGTTREACMGETMANLRPKLGVLALIADDWRDRGFMLPGEVPADWRQQRIAVRVGFPPQPRFPNGLSFLDVEASESREFLRVRLATELHYLGYDDLDVSTIRGPDRRVTRWISAVAYDEEDDDGNPAYAGIRYLSRHDNAWECWAVFGDVEIQELEFESILAGDEDVRRVASRFSLRVF